MSELTRPLRAVWRTKSGGGGRVTPAGSPTLGGVGPEGPAPAMTGDAR